MTGRKTWLSTTTNVAVALVDRFRHHMLQINGFLVYFLAFRVGFLLGGFYSEKDMSRVVSLFCLTWHWNQCERSNWDLRSSGVSIVFWRTDWNLPQKKKNAHEEIIFLMRMFPEDNLQCRKHLSWFILERIVVNRVHEQLQRSLSSRIDALPPNGNNRNVWNAQNTYSEEA